eukprot:4576240-Alexandrium_andersonii.AAC.1
MLSTCFGPLGALKGPRAWGLGLRGVPAIWGPRRRISDGFGLLSGSYGHFPARMRGPIVQQRTSSAVPSVFGAALCPCVSGIVECQAC